MQVIQKIITNFRRWLYKHGFAKLQVSSVTEFYLFRDIEGLYIVLDFGIPWMQVQAIQYLADMGNQETFERFYQKLAQHSPLEKELFNAIFRLMERASIAISPEQNKFLDSKSHLLEEPIHDEQYDDDIEYIPQGSPICFEKPSNRLLGRLWDQQTQVY